MNQGNKNGYPYYYFYEYLPTRYEATTEQQRIRQLVFSFKDGRHSELLEKIISGMNSLINGDRSRWTICCIPASTKLKTKNRYESLLSTLSNSLRINNGYALISVRDDHEAGHLGAKPDNIIPLLNFSNYGISGKKIILIDDVITRGTSFYQVADKLKSCGASEVTGLLIAKTINPDWHR